MTAEAPKRTVIQQYGPEKAGVKVGWTNLTEIEDTGVHVISGAFGRIGESGATLAAYELEGRRVYSDAVVQGIVQACRWQMVIKQDDVHKGERPLVQIGTDGQILSSLVGNTFYYDGPNITSDMLVEGDEAITDAIRTTLKDAGLEDEYAHTYLAINGWVGSEMERADGNVSRWTVATEQIFDPAMGDEAAAEHATANAYARYLSGRANDLIIAKMNADNGNLTAGDYLKLREKGVAATRAGERASNDLAVLKLVYTPEDYPMSNHIGRHNDVSIVETYLPTMMSIEKDGPVQIAESLETELKRLRPRVAFARRGAKALSLLTLDVRNQMFPGSV